MIVYVLKGTDEFFFDEPIEIARCPICELPVMLPSYERVCGAPGGWEHAKENLVYAALPAIHCVKCGHHLNPLVPSSPKALPDGWKVVIV